MNEFDAGQLINISHASLEKLGCLEEELKELNKSMASIAASMQILARPPASKHQLQDTNNAFNRIKQEMENEEDGLS